MGNCPSIRLRGGSHQEPLLISFDLLTEASLLPLALTDLGYQVKPRLRREQKPNEEDLSRKKDGLLQYEVFRGQHCSRRP